MKKRNAFTLAEVLITIAILGIVAVMVMPIITTDVNKHTWTNGLRTAVSNLSNAFEQMMAIDITNRLEGTNLWQNIINAPVVSANNDVRNELGRYLSITDMGTGIPDGVTIIDQNNAEAGADVGDTVRFHLSNGTILYMRLYDAGRNRKTSQECRTIKSNGGSLCSWVADMYVDVNGIKRPNRIGDDIYYFYLGSDGRLYPYGSNDVNLYLANIGTWRDSCDGRKPLPAGCDSRMLTARVIEEGYSINY